MRGEDDQPPGDLQAVRLRRARNTLLTLVRNMLAGSGLDIRDRRPVWQFFGHRALTGHHDDHRPGSGG